MVRVLIKGQVCGEPSSSLTILLSCESSQIELSLRSMADSSRKSMKRCCSYFFSKGLRIISFRSTLLYLLGFG